MTIQEQAGFTTILVRFIKADPNQFKSLTVSASPITAGIYTESTVSNLCCPGR